MNKHINWYLCVLLVSWMYSLLNCIMFCMLPHYWFDCPLCIVFSLWRVCLSMSDMTHSKITFSCNINMWLSCSKGRDSETSLYSVSQLLLFFVLILKQSLCACVGYFLILIGAQFFTSYTDVLHFLIAWKFKLPFDGLSGDKKGKLLARVTMAVLRLVQMIAYLKSGRLY